MKRFFLLSPIVFLSVCILASFNTVPLPVAGGGITVIVNKENPVASLTASEVKLYFLRKLKGRWPELNKNIRPADRKNKCSERDAFYTTVLGMDDAAVEEYFTTRQEKYGEHAPEKFVSDEEMINFVSEELGGIGYVGKLSAKEKEKVKVILIVGN
ncbi:MAG: hypothetical protein HY840_02275 [Bacteroidetes bacterium]|nr:hypothetical protein [Bacteroidota bacterium]